jgi:hypothetical protein
LDELAALAAWVAANATGDSDIPQCPSFGRSWGRRMYLEGDGMPLE